MRIEFKPRNKLTEKRRKSFNVPVESLGLVSLSLGSVELDCCGVTAMLQIALFNLSIVRSIQFVGDRFFLELVRSRMNFMREKFQKKFFFENPLHI